MSETNSIEELKSPSCSNKLAFVLTGPNLGYFGLIALIGSVIYFFTMTKVGYMAGLYLQFLLAKGLLAILKFIFGGWGH